MVETNLLIAAWIELLICWIAWCAAFIKPGSKSWGQETAVRAPSSRKRQTGAANW